MPNRGRQVVQIATDPQLRAERMGRSWLPQFIVSALLALLIHDVEAAVFSDESCGKCNRLPDRTAQLAQALATTLQENVEQWLAVSDRIRSSGALTAGGPMPDNLTAARASFETSWLNAGFLERKAVPHAQLQRALAAVVRSYRFQET